MDPQHCKKVCLSVLQYTMTGLLFAVDILVDLHGLARMNVLVFHEPVGLVGSCTITKILAKQILPYKTATKKWLKPFNLPFYYVDFRFA